MQQNKEFSALRAYLWPIHARELRKFFPLLLIAFFIGFNYNILRIMKESLLVTAEGSGAEVIPFIKVWGILPGALLMTFIYTRLNNRLARDRLFQVMIGIFLGFFALFTFVAYPLQDHIHPHETASWLTAVLPSGFKGLIAMIRYWSFSGFYIMSELWSSTVLSMLFWGFANQVTRMGEAKRFYGLISIGLNVSAIFSGQVSYFLTTDFLYKKVAFVSDAWYQSVILLTVTVLISGVVILAVYRYMTKKVLPTSHDTYGSQDQTPKIKTSMRENFAILTRSKHLFYLAIIVLSYNVIINLTEVLWKDQVNRLFPNPLEFNGYMSQITTITGVIAFFTSFLISGQVIRKSGWTFAALLTPLILLVTSLAFFFVFFGGGYLFGVLTMLGTTPLALAVFFGSLQNCLSRAAKFSLFDATKEIAFIPLDHESKLKGKAAIDGVGSRLGKSGGSVVHQGLLLIFATIPASAPFVAAIIGVILFCWTSSILQLGKLFHTADGDKPLEPMPLMEKKEEVAAIAKT